MKSTAIPPRALSLIIALIVLSAINGCVQDDRTCFAGKGKGNLRVVIHPYFNGQPVDVALDDTVYIDYGKSSFAGSSPNHYEAKVYGAAGTNYIDITKLNCGIYYFYVVSSNKTTGDRFSGGASFTTDEISGNFNIVVPLKAD